MDQKNLILAIVVSLIILLGWQFFIAAPQQEEARQATLLRQQQESAAQAPGPDGLPLPRQGPGVTFAPDRDAVVEQSVRVPIETPSLRGSINLIGARLDDLTLVRFRDTIEPDSPLVTLLSPVGATDPYFAEFGWVDGTGNAYGGGTTPWQTSEAALHNGDPLILQWRDETGLTFTRTIAVDENYMFTITQRVENDSDRPVRLHPFGRVTRINTPDTLGFYILHEGPIGVFNSTLDEVDYDDLQDDGPVTKQTVGGWIGITDKYWLAALVPDQGETFDTRFIHTLNDGVDRYQADYLGREYVVERGATVTVTNRLFAGAKQIQLLDHYAETLGIDRFDFAIDFGWFFFLTKPLMMGLIWIGHRVGNFGIAILLLTVAVKAVFFPLANKSYRSMSRMKALQPKMQELRAKYSEDKQLMQKELMALYKREKVNPVSGCLPVVIQIPVFFALYKVLFVSIEMRQAPFFGWIQDLSVQDPTTVFNLFGLIPFDPPSFLALGAWPLIMGLSMFLQQKLNPQPADPMQAKIFLMMPVMFTIFLARFPAGLVIYWSWNNILSIAQQYAIMRRAGVTISGKRTA